VFVEDELRHRNDSSVTGVGSRRLVADIWRLVEVRDPDRSEQDTQHKAEGHCRHERPPATSQ